MTVWYVVFYIFASGLPMEVHQKLIVSSNQAHQIEAGMEICELYKHQQNFAPSVPVPDGASYQHVCMSLPERFGTPVEIWTRLQSSPQEQKSQSGAGQFPAGPLQ